ncbi:MAG: hypothetical protein ACXAB4_01085 [Candidatus Hodarchaeales archaeon]|jgi:hypothetical protein
MVEKEIEDQDWLVVYDFWKDVPTIMEVDNECFEKVVQQNFRDAILVILRKGVEDDYTRENSLARRHALSAPEILPLLEEKLGYEPRLSNIYFHLEKLEKANLVRKVAKRLEGRHYVTYYGRTCKLIIGGVEKESKTRQLAFILEVWKLAEALGVKINRKRLNGLLNKIYDRSRELYQMEKEWLEKNHQAIVELDIGVLELYEFLVQWFRGRDSYSHELFSEFYKELGLEIYSS